MMILEKWALSPYSLISLWEIVVAFFPALFLVFDGHLRRLEAQFLAASQAGTNDSSEREELNSLIIALEGQFKQLNMQASWHRLARLRRNTKSNPPAAFLAGEIRILREVIEDELKSKYFLFVPKWETYQFPRKGWESVIGKFPSAASDIDEASRCLSLGRHTGCIYHLMRIAEHGLRAVARERSVVLTKNKPLEWANWQEIIKATEKEVEKINQTAPAGPEKDKALAFYAGALGQCHAFKDLYRNNAMHARNMYHEHQAGSAMLHVREFMCGLSTKIGERTKKEIKWGL